MSIVRYQVKGTTFEVDSRYYTLQHAIGQGAYGTVCSAEDVRTKRKVAIKKVTNAFVDVDTRRILREIKLLRHFKHENIIAIQDILKPPSKPEFRDIYIVTDLMDTDLHQIIRSDQTLTDQHVQYFMYQILRGLKCIHSANVLHRDLKPSNILLNANCDLKICDFGLARGEVDQNMTYYVATRWYRAPELIMQWGNYDKAIDMWSVGCIFCELLGRKAIFPGANFVDQLRMIIKVLGSQTPQDVDFGSDQARRFVLAMPPQRPIPFLSLYPHANPLALDLISKLLQFNPQRRPDVDQCLAHPYFEPIRDPSDEPTALHFNLDFEKFAKTPRDMKRMMYEEICHFHPEMIEEQKNQSFDPQEDDNSIQEDDMIEEIASDQQQSPFSPDAEMSD